MRNLTLSVLTVLLASASPALAEQPSPGELSLGAATQRLRPASGADQTLKGGYVGLAFPLDRSWNLEARYTSVTGIEAGSVALSQWTLLGGLRYTWNLGAGCHTFVHFLLGPGQLTATDDTATTRSSSLTLAPGAALDFALADHVALRCQGDLVFTRYGANRQVSPLLTLGLLFK